MRLQLSGEVRANSGDVREYILKHGIDLFSLQKQKSWFLEMERIEWFFPFSLVSETLVSLGQCEFTSKSEFPTIMLVSVT